MEGGKGRGGRKAGEGRGKGRGREGEGEGRGGEGMGQKSTRAIVLADGPVQFTHFQCIANLQSVVVQNQELEVALARGKSDLSDHTLNCGVCPTVSQAHNTSPVGAIHRD